MTDIKDRLRTEVDGNTALYEEAADRIEELEARIVMLEACVRSEVAKAVAAERERLLPLLDEILITMRHAEVFLQSREKMHPVGRKLWLELKSHIVQEAAARRGEEDNDK